MKKLYVFRVIAACLLIIPSFFSQLEAQCILLPNAVPDVTLTHVNTNCFNNSGVAYNPLLGLYYGDRAGNTGFPLETWDATGAPLYQTTTGFDYRGMWWNPNLNQMEANGYNTSGWWKANLNGSGYALNTGTNIFTGLLQPNSQSCGDLDYDANEVIFYSSGQIYRYSRATGTFLGNYPITGLPVGTGNLNTTTVFYTGCAGMEVAVLDYVQKKVYLINKATGAYAATSTLPGTAVTTGSFRCSYTNDRVFLFNLSNYTWYSYKIFDSVLEDENNQLSASLSPKQDLADISWKVEKSDKYIRFDIEKSVNGEDFVHFTTIENPNGNGEQVFDGIRDVMLPNNGSVQYRVRLTDRNGAISWSKIATIVIDRDEELEITMYPNPTDDNVSLFFNQGFNQEVIVTVYDESGKLIENRELGVYQAGLSFEWSTENYPNGVYFVRINTGTQLINKKLSVIH